MIDENRRRAPPITTTMDSRDYSTHEHILEKRRPKVDKVRKIGGLTCNFPPGQTLKLPDYPSAPQVTAMENLPPGNRGINGRLLYTMQRWYIARNDRGAIPSVRKVDTRALPRAGTGNEPVHVGGNINPRVNIDHVCMFAFTYYTDFSTVLTISVF
jgi:hypothetical protein